MVQRLIPNIKQSISASSHSNHPSNENLTKNPSKNKSISPSLSLPPSLQLPTPTRRCHLPSLNQISSPKRFKTHHNVDPNDSIIDKKLQAIIDKYGPSKVLLRVQSLLDVNHDVGSSTQTSSLTHSITSATDWSELSDENHTEYDCD